VTKRGFTSRPGLVFLAAALAIAASGAGSASAETHIRTVDDSVKKGDVDGDAPASVARELLVQFGAAVRAEERRRVHAARGSHVAGRIAPYDVELARLPRGVSIAAAAARYRSDPRVVAAEPNYLRARLETVPNDPLFSDLWGFRNTFQLHLVADWPSRIRGNNDADIDASEAWDIQQGSSETVIAIIDDGVDVGHPDLSGSIWQNPGEVAGNGLDDDANGKVDDTHGWDVAANDATLLAPPGVPGGNAHGTHVAGLVAAQINNGAAGAGVCPGCKLMVVKVMDDAGRITLASLLRGLAYAKREGADIVNISLGSVAWSALERAAIATSPFLVVGSAGNASLDNDMLLQRDIDGDGRPDAGSPTYPASYTLANIVSVAASNHRDEYGYGTGCFVGGASRSACSFTNWGHDSVDVAAPGVDIVSTVPGNGYTTWNGTSMAAPHVAGIAGLVKSRNPSLSAVAIRNAIMRSVDKPASLTTLTSQVFSVWAKGAFTRTSGRVNANTALTASTLNATARTDGNVDGAKPMTRRSVPGALRWPDDVNDVWKRKLYARVTYRVVLDGPAGSDFDLFIWKPRTKEIWQIESACRTGGSACRLLRWATTADADEATRFTARATGVYYFHVSAWLRNAGGYALRIRRI
jgi:subtilisin family serine protease